jgi:hypothetical protein
LRTRAFLRLSIIPLQPRHQAVEGLELCLGEPTRLLAERGYSIERAVIVSHLLP